MQIMCHLLLSILKSTKHNDINVFDYYSHHNQEVNNSLEELYTNDTIVGMVSSAMEE